MSGHMRLAGNAWPTRALDEREKAEHLANAPIRADDAIQASKAYRRTGFWFGIAGCVSMVAAAVSFGAAAYNWTPSQPVYAMIDPAGRVEPLIRAVDAPQRFTEATSKQYLRMYLDVCEPYRYETAKLFTHRCALLLSPDQQTKYAEWFGPSNDSGPQATFGRTGSISIADNVTYTMLGAQGRTQVWSMRFMRVEFLNRQVVCRPWQATVTFQFRPDLKMSDTDRTWNLAGMQILDRVSQPDSSAPSPTRCF